MEYACHQPIRISLCIDFNTDKALKALVVKHLHRRLQCNIAFTMASVRALRALHKPSKLSTSPSYPHSTSLYNKKKEPSASLRALFVRAKGLEPPRLTAPDPKSGLATITTRPPAFFRNAKVAYFL